MRSMGTRWIALGLWLSGVGSTALARVDEPKTYQDHVFPILRNRCLQCHNTDRSRGGLDLSTYEGLMAGGGGGAVVEAGSPDSSRLYTLSAHLESPKMPPNGDPMPADKLKVLSDWISGGLLETAGSKAKKPKRSSIAMDASSVVGIRPQKTWSHWKNACCWPRLISPTQPSASI